MRYLEVSIEVTGYPHDAVQAICSQLSRQSDEWTAYREIGDHHFHVIPPIDVRTEQANMQVSHTRIKGRISEQRLYTLLGAMILIAPLIKTIDIQKDV